MRWTVDGTHSHRISPERWTATLPTPRLPGSVVGGAVQSKGDLVTELIDRAILGLANAAMYLFAHGPVRPYRAHHGRWPDVAEPKRYFEPMLWRKIVDHNPQFVVFTDKLATKAYHRRGCPAWRSRKSSGCGTPPRGRIRAASEAA